VGIGCFVGFIIANILVVVLLFMEYVPIKCVGPLIPEQIE
jgi:hypothetical protein